MSEMSDEDRGKLADLEIRLAREPFDVEAYYEKACFLLGTERALEAYHSLDAAIEMAGDSHHDRGVVIDARLLRADLFLQHGHEDGFFQDMTLAYVWAVTDEQRAAVCFDVGTFFYEREEFDKAAAVFQKGVFHDQADDDMVYGLARARYFHRDYVGVVVALPKQVVERFQDQRFYRIRGLAEWHMGNVANATQDLARARELYKLTETDEDLFSGLLQCPQVNRGPW